MPQTRSPLGVHLRAWAVNVRLVRGLEELSQDLRRSQPLDPGATMPDRLGHPGLDVRRADEYEHSGARGIDRWPRGYA
jgi:hypothetical protein